MLVEARSVHDADSGILAYTVVKLVLVEKRACSPWDHLHLIFQELVVVILKFTFEKRQRLAAQLTAGALVLWFLET